MPEQALTFVTCGSGGSLGGELTGITHGAKQVSPLLGIACLKKGEPSHDIAENKSHGSKLSWIDVRCNHTSLLCEIEGRRQVPRGFTEGNRRLSAWSRHIWLSY